MFGDGGITAYGANVFNMGVVMPFTGILVYIGAKRLWKMKANIFAPISKRAIAGFIAGYVGIVVAALCAAIEFGIQPSIAPGYAPYGLDLAIPAMVGAHLLVGIAEGLTTAIVVYYLSENRSDLLNLTKFCPGWLEKYMEKVPENIPSVPSARTKMPVGGKGGEKDEELVALAKKTGSSQWSR